MLLALFAASAILAADPSYVRVTARFVPPPTAGTDGAIAVTLSPLATGIVVNETPAPRLKLDPAQAVLIDKQPARPAGTGPLDPSQAKYLDPRLPVLFPVALAPAAPHGTRAVRADVTYYYCSKSEGWCRKGVSEIAVDVSVP
jgi:hypothetical protein